MLARQAAWLSANKHDAHFAEYFTSFLNKSSFTKYCCSVLDISHQRCYVALTSRQSVTHSSKHSGESRPFAQLMAFPFVVSRESCDDAVYASALAQSGDAHAAVSECNEPASAMSAVRLVGAHHDAFVHSPVMQTGFATLLCDSLTSVHVMQSLAPARPMHVSVNMLTRVTSTAARALRSGDQALLVSKIEKFGKRIIYCSARVYLDEDTVSVAREFAEGQTTSAAELEEQLACYQIAVSYSHVKNVMQSA